MRILFIGRQFYPCIGGTERFMLEYARRLIKKGHRVDVLTARKNVFTGDKFLCDETFEGIRIHRVQVFGSQRIIIPIYNPLRVYKLFINAEIIHLHDLRLFFVTSFILKIILNKSLVFETYGMFFHTPQYRSLKKFIFDLIILPILQRADRVIAISEHDYSLFPKSWLGRMHSKVSILAGGVDFEKFSSVKKKIKPGELVYLGRVAHNKGIDLLLITLSRIPDVDYQLYILGSGEKRYLASMQDLARELKINSRVHWLGFLNDEEIIKELSKAQFLVFPSRYEGFGLALLEGMATGTVPVVNNIDTFRDIISPGRNGFLVNFVCPAEASRYLRELINKTPVEIEHIGLRAQEKARMFDWDSRVQKLEKIYRELLIDV